VREVGLPATENDVTRSRRLGALAAGFAVAASIFAGAASAQDYPVRPIRLIVAFTAGGTTDFMARLLADKLKGALGQPVIVENRAGANGAIAADFVAKAEPDGYTLFFTTVGAVAINPGLRNDLPYDPLKDFAPVGMAAFNSTMLVVNAAMKVDSAQELAALAKAKPGIVTIGVTGIGAVSHLGLELFSAAAGIKLTIVPYRGASQAITDILGGSLDGLMGDVPTVLTQIQAGKLKALAATSTKRSDIFPDVPTFVEQGFAGTVAGHARARPHATGGDRQAQWRAGRGPRRSRRPRQAQAERGDALARFTGGVRPLSQGRDRPLRPAHPREGHQGGVAKGQRRVTSLCVMIHFSLCVMIHFRGRLSAGSGNLTVSLPIQ
jgi:tripartite-type tricarboxylate transporter receptor subunit TctC